MLHGVCVAVKLQTWLGPRLCTPILRANMYLRPFWEILQISRNRHERILRMNHTICERIRSILSLRSYLRCSRVIETMRTIVDPINFFSACKCASYGGFGYDREKALATNMWRFFYCQTSVRTLKGKYSKLEVRLDHIFTLASQTMILDTGLRSRSK